ncbi:MAG: ATP-binding protein [Bacteroidota bacterium]
MNQLPTINTLDSIQDFHSREVWKEKSTSEQLKRIVKQITYIRSEVEKIVEEATERFEEGIATKQEYFIVFQWTLQAKSYLLLWRDVAFQLHKAYILHLDGQYSKEDLFKLQEASEKTLQEAHQDFQSFTEHDAKSVGNKEIARWKHQKSPWSTYQEQIKEIEEQSQALLVQNQTLTESVGYFDTIQNIINNLLEDCDKEVERIKKLAKEDIELIHENLEGKTEIKYSKVINHLEDREKNYFLNHHLKAFLDRWENEKLVLPRKQQFVVDTNEGLLLFKELDLNKGVRQWTDSEILPVLYEVWDLLERVERDFKISLSNIRNRITLLSKEENTPETIDSNNLCFPLESFLEKVPNQEQLLSQLSKSIADKLNEEFQIAQIFDPEKNFLSVPFQSTVNQFRLNQSPTLSRISNWWKNQTSKIRQVRQTVEQGETLSVSERIVRLIQQRKVASENLQYASIFQTEGYIGESFFIGRKQELERIDRLIHQWYEGFRGSLLLTGQRFTGKTLLGEYISNRYFSTSTIRLSPQTNIEVQGRKLMTSYDLGEALEFIQKYSIGQQPMVWIDDLELWRDPQIHLGSNVRQLFNYFDRYSSRIFFLVSMSNWMKEHLSKYYEINRVFQANINLDKMSAEEVQNAILVRHGATHKTLVNKEAQEISANQFRKLTNRVYKAAEGNIGEALLRWSYAISPVENSDKVRYTESIYSNLPDFLNSDTAILLSTIIMQKRTNEYRLRKLFGQPFNENYSGLLQRLLNVGILTRDALGWLEINELVVNDIGKLLERNKYISFYQG